MNKPLAVFDVDGTMIPGTTYFRVIESQVANGIVAKDCLDEANKALVAYRNGGMAYEPFIAELLDIYATALAGKSASYIQRVTSDFIATLDDFYRYVGPTINALRDTHEVVIISGSPHFMSNAVRDRFGIEHSISSEYEVNGDFLTGKVSKYLATREQKLQEYIKLANGRINAGSCAFGDSEGDSNILESVDVAVCIRPTKGLEAIALAKSWIIENDLAVLNSESVLPSVHKL